MVLVTVVGELQCKRGFEFVYGGPLAECRDCKVRNICFHLDENKWYKVTEVRDVHHDCKIHEGGVRVVEVERIPTRAALPSRLAIDGATVTYEESDCNRFGCPNYKFCHPLSTFSGMRFKITAVDVKELDCQRGDKLKAVRFE